MINTLKHNTWDTCEDHTLHSEEWVVSEKIILELSSASNSSTDNLLRAADLKKSIINIIKEQHKNMGASVWLRYLENE